LQTKLWKAAALPWSNLRLPPFPQVAVRILQLAHDENVQMRQLCDLIATDPAFASEVLTIANSAFYAPRQPSTSIMEAIAVLGATKLQGMCLTVGIRAYLGKTMSLPALRALWRHNLACALISERLADAGPIDRDLAYTSGILHDIGRMALAVLQPKAYAELLESHHGPSASILEAERNLFGLDHCEAGHQLITSWKLPENFAAVVVDHLSPRCPDEFWDVLEVVKMSCAMASALGFVAFPGCEAVPFGELLEQLPERERSKFPAEPEQLRNRLSDNIKAVESI